LRALVRTVQSRSPQGLAPEIATRTSIKQPGGYQHYFSSGSAVAAIALADTKTQTVSVFEQMKGTLKEPGLTL
jgi:hypothetical protein